MFGTSFTSPGSCHGAVFCVLKNRCCGILTNIIAAVTAGFLPFSPNIPMANVLHLIWASALVSNDLLNATFTNNAVWPEERLVANGLAVTLETVGKAKKDQWALHQSSDAENLGMAWTWQATSTGNIRNWQRGCLSSSKRGIPVANRHKPLH